MACSDPSNNFRRSDSALLSRSLWVVLTLLGLTMTGCGGCQQTSQTARQQEKEKQKRGEEEAAKDKKRYAK